MELVADHPTGGEMLKTHISVYAQPKEQQRSELKLDLPVETGTALV